MSVKSQVYDFITEETDIDSRPSSVSIGYGSESIWKAGADADILLTCDWYGDAVPERFIETPDLDDNTSELESISSTAVIERERRFLSINSGDDLYTTLRTVLEAIEDSITLKDPASVTSITANFNIDRNTDSDYSGEWANDLTGYIGGFVGIELQKSVSSFGEILIENVVEVLKKKFETDKVDTISEVTLLFSDFKYTECITCSVVFETTAPEDFYDIESVDEYIGHMAETETEKAELVDQELYELELRVDIEYDSSGELRMGNQYLDSSITEVAEQLLQETVNEFVTVSVPAPVEAESIILTPDSQEISWWHRPQLSKSDIV